MPCTAPLQAWRVLRNGTVTLRSPPDIADAPPGSYEYLRLPCGGCLGCRRSRAREWALRCWLESQEHESNCWVTLTYAESPGTLVLRDLQLFMKRLRARSRVRFRFFASGEYGEKLGRPHYHALLFGLARDCAPVVTACWPHGYARTDPLTPQAISYVAGYTAKKVGWRGQFSDLVDPETGEVLREAPRPPFIVMSRRPGLGAAARDRWPQSWRKFAVLGSAKMPVPRFLHQSWKAAASPEDLEALRREKAEIIRDTSRARLEAQAAINQAQHNLQAQRRSL